MDRAIAFDEITKPELMIDLALAFECYVIAYSGCLMLDKPI